jgi:hypothetical protein
VVEHVLGEVQRAVAGRLGADQAAAELHGLAGQHALEGAADALELPEEVADLAPAHADVARGHVGVGADVLAELGHERLAEAHDLAVALALGVEVRPALAGAHRQAGQAVLEGLLEREELEHALRHRRVEPQAALVRADAVRVLDAVAAVDLDLALVVLPATRKLKIRSGSVRRSRILCSS